MDYADQFARRRDIEVSERMQQERVRTQDRAMPERDTRDAAQRYRDKLVEAGERGETQAHRMTREHREQRQRGPRLGM